MVKSWQEWAFILVALMGVVIATYGVGLHFAPDDSSFCNISASFNCDKVNKSPWATILGIPVAALGLLAYLFVALLVTLRKVIERISGFTSKDFWQYISIIVFVMLAFQIYLTCIEVFVIGALCIVCLGSQLAVIMLAILSGGLWAKSV